MHSVNVTVPSPAGLGLAATIDFPDTEPKAFAIFSHCFTGNRHTPCASRVSKTLSEYGYAVLRFDYPGLGQSEGEFADQTFTSNCEDLYAVYEWLEENYEAPALLVGHSLGGAAALRTGQRMKKLKAIATIGAPFDPAHAVFQFPDAISEVDRQGDYTFSLVGRTMTISRKLLEDLAETNPETYLPDLKKPLLLLHSPTDQTVGIDSAQLIFQVSRYPKSLVALDKTDHLCTKPGSAARAGRLIAEWAEPYTQVGERFREQIDETVAEARSTRTGKYTDAVRAGVRHFISDRETTRGGKGYGITPTGLLMSAIATSTSQQIRVNAKKLRIRGLDNVHVEVQQTPTAATEVADFTGDGSFDLTRSIELTGRLSDDEVARLTATLDDPLIHSLLEGALNITDTITNTSVDA
ncbi:alpha/beta fold hydrolase [Corynebacterium sp. HMSC073D01]|uniref:bifunctional alpha/beta hydrolase/OsmC family protein n=1 Tax=Corynebacterium sp. HMSC073D01 TaxID=1739536 RepID=UPI0008A574C2|nr:alpha/beta fold hydrolase [Corynebacterium sp. HMSC073D01]OFO43401.1 alpha/beta hydrolase [Corynebacterium sp. HMSC073D01]